MRYREASSWCDTSSQKIAVLLLNLKGCICPRIPFDVFIRHFAGDMKTFLSPKKAVSRRGHDRFRLKMLYYDQSLFGHNNNSLVCDITSEREMQSVFVVESIRNVYNLYKNNPLHYIRLSLLSIWIKVRASFSRNSTVAEYLALIFNQPFNHDNYPVKLYNNYAIIGKRSSHI